jgi:hypothetical protein
MRQSPAPVATPMAATIQMAAAVVSPSTPRVSCRCRITPAPDEAHAGDDPLQHPARRRGVGGLQQQADDDKRGRAERHQRVRPQPGGLPFALAVQPDERTEQRGQEEPPENVGEGSRNDDGGPSLILAYGLQVALDDGQHEV